MADSLLQTCENGTDENCEENLFEIEEDSDEEEDFFQYILDDNIEGVKLKLEDGYNALSVSKHGDMALHFATLNSKVDVLRVFESQLRNNAAINTVHLKNTDECGTALHTAMDGQVSVETVLFLSEWGADVNAKDFRGGTVLHELIDMAWVDFEEDFDREKYLTSNPKDGQSYLTKLSILHHHGADMNAIHDLTSLTPLHKWCQQFFWCTKKCEDKGCIPDWCFMFLNKMLEYGCNGKCVNDRGENHLYYFAQRRYKETHHRFMVGYGRMCELLVRCSDLKQKNINGHTILHAAAEFSNIVIIRELLKHGIDVNEKDKFGLTAVHLITHNITNDERGLVIGILDLLLEHNGYINATDNHGSTPIHHAISMHNSTAVSYLIHHGADLQLKDNSGLDALELATITGGSEIQKHLGILYQRSQPEGHSGVTDFDTGYYYPRCCQWTGSETSFSEEAEIIKESQIKSFLETFCFCPHNTNFIIQNCMHFYDKKQRHYFLKDCNKLQDELMCVMEKIVTEVNNENKLFHCDFILGGSNAEGTKVGAPDEFDILFILNTLSNMVVPEENEEFKGFVKLKIKDGDSIRLSPSITNDNGYVKREALSCHFHKLLEKVLRRKEIFENTCFESHNGTVNAEGECWDIGQLNLKWYGPFRKRQMVKIDIVPVLQIPNWRTMFLNKNINIIDSKTMQSVGCFLVMKDARLEIANLTSANIEDTDLIETENQLFQISFSQLENAVIFHLPDEIRSGLKVAKTILLQSPRIGCKRVELNEDGICDQLLQTSDGPLFVTNVHHYLTSYKIKTALLHVLDDFRQRTNLCEADLKPESWNKLVMDANKLEPRESNLCEVLKWTRRIYKKLLHLAKLWGHIPDYFLSRQKMTGNIVTTQNETNVLAEYCEIMLRLTENFKVPDHFASSTN
ncbi:uncharacterized protein LOC133193434 [Saccostrea echinata]|uniref:uncharacterized protein LOC133193434 n=1 Tax=Saccostrea echinata TaxID=191078 RepID=UPI002A837F04|nr:uncharacterized protein LOC133193434 [Saccostrea echinata]